MFSLCFNSLEKLRFESQLVYIKKTALKAVNLMVHRPRLELGTNGLKGHCSTIELAVHIYINRSILSFSHRLIGLWPKRCITKIIYHIRS